MMFDVRTILFISLMIDVICTIVMVLLWYFSRKRFAGTTFWVADFAFQTSGMLLIMLRTGLPEWMSVVLSNTLIVSGAILGFIGLERFLGKRGPQVQNVLLLFIFICSFSYFTFIDPSLTSRNLLLSLGLLTVCFQCAWLLLHRAESGLSTFTRFVGIVFLLYSLVSLARIIEVLIFPSPNDLFQSRARDTIFIVAYQMLFILLMYGLSLMVNIRLFSDLRIQEDKLLKAFHASPNAILLTRLSNGEILKINDGFRRIALGEA